MRKSNMVSSPKLPPGALARIDVYPSGVSVNLRRSMATSEFVAMLRKIADGYESKTITIRKPS